MKSDKIISIAAIFISVSTLIVIFYQTNLMRKQQYASVLPYLEIAYSYPNENEFSMFVRNTGVGPAFINYVAFLADSQIFEGDFNDFYKNYLNKIDTLAFGYSSIFKGKLIQSGEKIDFLMLRDPKMIQKVLHRLNKNQFSIRINYASIYEEKWQINSDGNGVPVRID